MSQKPGLYYTAEQFNSFIYYIMTWNYYKVDQTIKTYINKTM